MLGNIFFVTFMLFGTLLVNCKLVNQIEEETVIEGKKKSRKKVCFFV